MASTETEESDENEGIIRIQHPSIFEVALNAPQISSIEEASDWRQPQILSIEEASDWRQKIFSYLQDGTLPSGKKSAMQLRMRA
jgi:hypothetical protein